MKSIRLLSYNIHKGIGGSDRRYSLERILEVIAGEKPDLVCLQEVDRNVRRSRFHDQPALLAEQLGFPELLYQLNVSRLDGGYGNLILSRWPLHKSLLLCLRLKRRKPRGAQLAVVDTPHGPLHLVNCHLGLAERERHWQVNHLLDHVEFRANGHLPTLITGDFNDWRNTLCQRRFAAHAFRQATDPAREFRSFPAFFPLAALDKAFYRGPVALRHAGLVRTRLSRRASDHLPLVLDFHLTGTHHHRADVGPRHRN